MLWVSNTSKQKKQMQTLVHRAKKSDIWRWAWDKDTAEMLCEVGWAALVVESLSEAPGSEFCEPLTDVSWLPTWKNKYVNLTWN